MEPSLERSLAASWRSSLADRSPVEMPAVWVLAE
jgi:hypothetical protein